MRGLLNAALQQQDSHALQSSPDQTARKLVPTVEVKKLWLSCLFDVYAELKLFTHVFYTTDTDRTDCGGQQHE